jgi:FixJ family two-component response regulator
MRSSKAAPSMDISARGLRLVENESACHVDRTRSEDPIPSADDVESPNPDEARPLVYICDHDMFSSHKLQQILGATGFDTQWFTSSSELLAGIDDLRNSCVISEVRLPGSSGVHLPTQFQALRKCTPIILMTSGPSVSLAVNGMKAGAIDFITKPLREHEVMTAVFAAIARDSEKRRELEGVADIRSRFESLSRREQQVMKAVVSGALNKQIASDLKITEVTVKLHRRSSMRKMAATSLADLVRKWEAMVRPL